MKILHHFCMSLGVAVCAALFTLGVPQVAGAQSLAELGEFRPIRQLYKNYYRCAEEKGTCDFKGHTADLFNSINDKFSTVYGTFNRSIIIESRGLRTIPCRNVLGDPAPNARKTCFASVRGKVADLDWWAGKYPDPPIWRVCGKEGQRCSVPALPPGSYVIAVYGVGSDFGIVNRVASDFDCGNGGFGFNFDPVPNAEKRCSISIRTYQGHTQYTGGTWKKCGDEGGDCALVNPYTPPRHSYAWPKSDCPGDCHYVGPVSYLVRYGVSDRTRYLYRTVVGSGIACNSDAFGNDPAPGVAKTCEYIVLRPAPNG